MHLLYTWNVVTLIVSICLTACEEPECYDELAMCHWWADRGRCETHPSAMNLRCPYSCLECTIEYPCYNLPCKNGGTCIEDSGTPYRYICNCTGTGFKGRTCGEYTTEVGHSINLTNSVTSEKSIAEGRVSTAEIIRCFVSRNPIQITAFNGSVSMDDETLRNSGLTGSSYKCLLKIVPPQGHFTAFTPVYIRGCGGEYDVVMNNTVFSCTYIRNEEWQPQNTPIFGDNNAVTFMEIKYVKGGVSTIFPERLRDEITKQFSFLFEFTSLPTSFNPLDIKFQNNVTGYISSPDWDGETTSYLRMDVTFTLDIPTDNVVMISVFDIDNPTHPTAWHRCFNTYVRFFTNAREKDHLSIHCGVTPYGPEVYDIATNVLYTRVWYGQMLHGRGFKIHVSFYPRSTYKTFRLSSGAWNCSVPQWSEFRHHFPCNLRAECQGMEDEEHCAYTTPLCGQGYIIIGGHCYKFSRTNMTKIFWLDKDVFQGSEQTCRQAAEWCHSQGAQLASLSSFQKVESTRQFVMDHGYTPVFVGMTQIRGSGPYIYKDMWRHQDKTVAYYLGTMKTRYTDDRSVTNCALLRKQSMRDIGFFEDSPAGFLCEQNPQKETGWGVADMVNSTMKVSLANVTMGPVDWPYTRCDAGNIYHIFLACDTESQCLSNSQHCSVPPYMCRDQVQFIPYTFVCDHRSDCGDDSDESFCTYVPCDVSSQFICVNKECVSLDMVCDDVPQCKDGSDENMCRRLPEDNDNSFAVPPPVLIEFTGLGSIVAHPLEIVNKSFVCPDTHFQCADGGYCLPVFVRCNQMYDCQGHEDEEDCDQYTCPGFYRCLASSVCVHTRDLCDGVYHCPQRDDELMCNAVCPENCTCFGMSFVCRGEFSVRLFPEIRYLDVSSTGLNSMIFSFNIMLIYLNISRCNITDLTLPSLPNLQTLDLSDNLLTSIKVHHIQYLPSLQHLILSHNPISSVFEEVISLPVYFGNLHNLDLSGVLLPQMDFSTLTIFPNLQKLNLSRCDIDQVTDKGFQSVMNARVIDLTGCPFTFFSKGLFEGLHNLEAVYADNYKLCCPVLLPEHFSPTKCKAPSDEVSSCESLLHSTIYRGVLSVFSVLSLLGNFVSFIIRVIIKKVNPKMGFEVFVASLCVADFLMGVYLAIIGVADRVYMGNYLWNDVSWRHSSACKFAGFLSFTSNEASAFMICLITLDRFLVLQFPFSNLRFKRATALLACGLAWAFAVLIAGVPLMPMTSHWQFYSQKGICIPLPITRSEFAGHDYAFQVMIVFNFVLFLLVAFGQLFIYITVQQNTLENINTSGKASRDLTLARRLITIAVTDFLCWFPIGLLGLMAANGVSIASEINVAVAILALPLNSAINPFLYTFNVILESRRRTQEQRLKQFILSQAAKKG